MVQGANLSVILSALNNTEETLKARIHQCVLEFTPASSIGEWITNHDLSNPDEIFNVAAFLGLTYQEFLAVRPTVTQGFFRNSVDYSPVDRAKIEAGKLCFVLAYLHLQLGKLESTQKYALIAKDFYQGYYASEYQRSKEYSSQIDELNRHEILAATLFAQFGVPYQLEQKPYEPEESDDRDDHNPRDWDYFFNG